MVVVIHGGSWPLVALAIALREMTFIPSAKPITVQLNKPSWCCHAHRAFFLYNV
jgi:hypothetical protein